MGTVYDSETSTLELVHKSKTVAMSCDVTGNTSYLSLEKYVVCVNHWNYIAHNYSLGVTSETEKTALI
ncbi:hypothetical protein J6590_087419 [Homalodisca vitripennis]|nr:hypothetical protein J6590_087419 [Homalodisca vitripennis]